MSVSLLLPLVLVLPQALAGFEKGPYLQNPTQGSMIVSWQSSGSSAGEVAYGTSSSLGSTVATAGADTFHEVEVTGLRPGTVYHYQVTADGETSRLSSFVTAPQDEQPFMFAVVGDTRTDGDEHQAVIDRLRATIGAPDFVINTGDLVEDGGDYEQWSTFFGIESQLMAEAPLFPVAGNHDDVENDSWYVQFFNLPESSSATENWYAFTFGNTRFVVVDTNEDFVTGSEQYTWLEGELSAADSDPALRHIIVSFHDPPYTSGAHGVFDPDDWQPPRTYLVPLFERYGVDVVFNGHDHHYERTDATQTGGVYYIVAGGGGAPGDPEDFVDGIGDIVGYLGMDEGETVGEWLEDNEWLLEVISWFMDGADEYENGWWRAEAEVVKHFVQVEVAGGYIEGNVYTIDGDLLDTWTIGSYDGDDVDDDGDGFTEREGDCDDGDPGINPDAVDDDCDGVDEDCDGVDGGCDDPDDTGDGPDDPDDTGDPDDPDDPDDPGDDDDQIGIIDDGCGCTSTPAHTPWAVLLATLIAATACRRRKHHPGSS
jgi:MYXO-CTERM domain-containing protein